MERAVESNPFDLDLIRRLALLSERVGWEHEGRTLGGWLDATLHADYERHHEFGPKDPRLLRPLGVRVLPALLDALTGEEARERWNACSYLGYLGSAARPAIPSLIQTLGGDDPTASHTARWALCRLGEWSKPALLKALAVEPNDLRVLDTLALMGSAALDVLDQIEAIGSRSREQVKERFEAAAREIRSETSEDETEILGSLSWSFGTGCKEDRELFEWEVWSAQIHLSIALAEPARADWRPARAVAPPRVVVDHEGYEGDLKYELRSANGGPLTAGELMFLLHNAAQEECDMTRCDHRFFEGLSCESRELDGTPRYFLYLGS